MLKNILLVTVVAGLTLFLAACGHYGHWQGHGYHGSSHSDHAQHSHYRGCGHSRY